jgi:hypothetical protein
MSRLLLISFLGTLTVVQGFGQDDFLLRPNKILPTTKQWEELQFYYNFLPTKRLEVMEKELNSTISTTDCYKFIHNPDTTKFIAFFIMRKENPKFERLGHFGRVVHKHYQPSDNDSISYLSYILWGMKYDGNWYYHKDREDEFWDKSDKSAKNDFLFYVLDDIAYFKKKNFWETGGATNQFTILSKNNSYLKEYAGLPEIVGWHKTFETRRKNDLLNEQIEKTACQIQNKLWSTLHRSDNMIFHSIYQSEYTGESCLVLYNSERSSVLLPIIYFDSKKQPWVRYYFLKINSTGATLYQWLKFPTKQIKRKPGEESLEIVYDIRTLIENWNWGTVNMISNDSFWINNFSETDLQLIENNVH